MAKKITIIRISIVPPKTIVYWSDKTKTESDATSDPFDEEKGVLICICKKFLGSWSEVQKGVDMGKNDVKEKIRQFNETRKKYK